jgi:KUP system potassium uptake protein
MSGSVLKYDNEGEVAYWRLPRWRIAWAGKTTPWSRAVIATGVFAAALFYGDAIITPGDLGPVGDRGFKRCRATAGNMVLLITAGIWWRF